MLRRALLLSILLFATAAAPAGATIQHFQLPDRGTPAAAVVEPNGDLRYFAYTDRGYQIGRVTPAGQITTIEAPYIPGSFGCCEMARSSDGALWIAKSSGDGIVRVAPDGSSKLTTWNGTYALSGVRTGPDGNAWTSSYSEDVQRWTVSAGGSLTGTGFGWGGDTSFSANSALDVAFADSKAFLIGTARGSGRGTTLIRIDPAQTGAGQRTEFPLPWPATTNYNWIVAGPDGLLWTATQDGSEVLRVSTAGAVAPPLALPAGAMAWHLTPGPADSVLLTTDDRAFGRLKADGSLQEYCPTGDQGSVRPLLSPDGSVWVLHDYGVVRMTLDSATTCAPAIGATKAVEGYSAPSLTATLPALGGETPKVSFEIGRTTAYDRSVDATISTFPEPDGYQASSDSPKLEPGVWHVRAKATNRFGTVHGPDTTFVMPGAPVVEALRDRVEPGKAIIDYAIEPVGRDAELWLEWGLEGTGFTIGNIRVGKFTAAGGRKEGSLVIDSPDYTARTVVYKLVGQTERSEKSATPERTITIPAPDRGTQPPSDTGGGTVVTGGGTVVTGGGGTSPIGTIPEAVARALRRSPRR